MSPIPISKTKIIPPSRRPQLLTRKRLLELMYEALDKKLTLISAPAGYGKTSLLIDLIHDQDNDWKNCWLALDELDREPQRFAAYFIEAIAYQFPQFGKQSNKILDSLNSFDQELERLIVTIINELIEYTAEYFVIYLDDFHLLDQVQPIKNFINRFIQLMPENCHVVISSRKITDFSEMLLLISRGSASGLDFADLAFKPEELQALIVQNESKHLSDEEAKRLIDETEGWVTGLQFSNIKLPSANDQSNLFNYFKQQVLDKQPSELREFILRTALIDEFDSNLCELVLQPLYQQKQDWQSLIKNTANNNAFALPVGENGNALRYHHLFRDFIREQIRRERPSEVQPILSQLQLVYESFEEWEKAHHICKQQNDTNALAELIERAGTFMIQHAPATLESWLNQLSPALLKNKPGLLSIRGVIVSLKNDYQESLKLLNEAEKHFRQDQEIPNLALTLTRRSILYRLIGEYQKSIFDSDEVIAFAENSTQLQSLYAEALRSKGSSLFRLGQAHQAAVCFEKSLNLFYQLNDKGSIPTVLVDAGMAYRGIGDYNQALSMYEKALYIWRQEGDVDSQALVLNNLGVFYQFLGQYEKSISAFEEGLLCVQRSRQTRMSALIFIGLGDVYSELEDFDTAQQNYQQALEKTRYINEPFLHHFLMLSQANLALRKNNIPLVNSILERVKTSIYSGNSKYEINLFEFILGRLALMGKETKTALEILNKVMQSFTENGLHAEAESTRVWYAAALCQDNNLEEAVQALNALTEQNGRFFNTALIAVYQAQNWLVEIEKLSKTNKFILDLYSQSKLATKDFSQIRRLLRKHVNIIPTSPPKYKIQAFGQPTVYINGKALTKSDWQTQSVRDLFFYFLTMPKPLPKEQIGEILWPELYDIAKLKLRFKNELYRLRKAVGQGVILFDDVIYRFNHELDYEYDVETFMSYIAKAEIAQEIKQKIDLYQKAVDLYQGPYLNDVYADWVMYDRERLGQSYSKTLQNLADLYLQDGKPETSIQVCEKGIHNDAGNERLYQIAMQAYQRQNDRASIIRMYQVCKETLQNLFGLSPSPDTEELFRKITR